MSPRVCVVFILVLAAGCASSDDDASPDAAPASTTMLDESTSTTKAPAVSTTATPVATTPVATTPVATTTPATEPATSEPVTTQPEVPLRPTITDLLGRSGGLNIAHAGGDQEWPHSTFYAYDQAVAAGADVLEMDVQLAADGVLIVQHDETVDGTTDGTGRADALTFDEITSLDAAHWYVPGCWPCRDRPDDAYVFRGVRTGAVPPPDGATPDDFRIISFAEAVERYPGMPFDIEIKGSGDAALATADALAAEIAEYGLTDHVVVVSFDDVVVEHFRSIAPGVDVSPGTGALTAWMLGGEPLDDAYRIIQVPPAFGGLTVISPGFWDKVAAAGLYVWVWPNDAATQENAEFYREMVDQGAHGIIAGRPSAMSA